jgi:hypothetical protein
VTEQYLRQVNLLVSKNKQGLDLSNMHIQFRIFAPDAGSRAPPTAYIRVWNLKKDTAAQIQKEFDHVSLQAGYSDPGMIFDGTIVQVKKGAEDAINSFVDIMASDLDEFYNYTLVSKTLAKGASQKDQAQSIVSAGSGAGATMGNVPADLGTGGTLPRGKVQFGMAKDLMDDVGRSSNSSWFVENGKVHLVKDDGYLPGDAVVLNSSTGMLGVPEATNNGIEVRCLLNPKIKVGTRVQINNSEITTTSVQKQGLFPTYGNINLQASLSADGMYRVLVIEHFGDNRGNQFESALTCLAVDATSGKIQ